MLQSHGQIFQISLIRKNPTLMQQIGFGGVTKSSRPPSKHCNPKSTLPWLELSPAEAKNEELEIFNISFTEMRKGYWRKWRSPLDYWYYWKDYVGGSNGSMICKGVSDSLCYVWKPIHGTVWFLPNWVANVPFRHATSYGESNREVLMVITGISHPSFMFAGLGKMGNEWFKLDCTIVEPHRHQSSSSESDQKHYMEFTNAIGLKGKFYALSLQETLAVVEVLDSEPLITALGAGRAIPSVGSKHFRGCLLESNGEILLVFLISRQSIDDTDVVEIYGLDLEKLSWVRVKSLGERTLIVGSNCCSSILASKVGCRRNFVYFGLHTGGGWWVFDMDGENISSGLADSKSTMPWMESETEEL
ncbi:hypothetical protein HS088_TW17G00924 [Tripterygium wilfordii]|uniref:KIB1-4 beta-propeller domain-containing protein n=1 Tax=Tripterygium wilfordii TaxID=458696 RepID=A0A7J7CH71_TRIWF|nr:hypothetical protein HS088_TW17G00924 [Tripterygium wilfordii]